MGTPGQTVTNGPKDAGSYTLEITAAGYEFSEGTNVIPITITPADLTNLALFNGTVLSTSKPITAPLTSTQGSALQASNVYVGYSVGNKKWVQVPTNGVTATKTGPDGKAFTGAASTAGTYNVTLSFNAATLGNNYICPNEPITLSFVVLGADGTVYADVPASIWFYGDVYQAAALGYMTGLGGTNLFDPYGDLNRAQAAVVIAKMAGQYKTLTDPDEVLEFDNNFTDVPSGKWYTNCVAWANEAGIVTGYGPSYTTFGPMNNVTRAQFATMLARYAQATNKYTAPTDVDATLADYTDAASIPSYAKEAIAWAVENKIMGVNTPTIDPSSPIIRAEAAAMTVCAHNGEAGIGA